MPRGVCTFRKRDLTAAIEAAIAAGIEVAGVEVRKDGTIIIKIATPVEKAANDNFSAAGKNLANPWDRVLK
jgi:hypothetical protein